MDLMSSNYMQGDPGLIDQIVYELKSQGIFDQFRKECISDVDTKPAYQNLRRRVEGSVTNFLKKQKFSLNLNKNQLREQLRKNLSESGFLEIGVERIVDQVVNPKINTTFLQKVEDVVYKFLGVQKPKREDNKEDESNSKDVLMKDLEAVSPTPIDQLNNSDKATNDKDPDEANTSFLTANDSGKTEDDESPPFEPIEPNTSFILHDEHSIESNISENSTSNNNNNSAAEEFKPNLESDISQDYSVASNSGGMNTDDNDNKLEIDESTTMEVDDIEMEKEKTIENVQNNKADDDKNDKEPKKNVSTSDEGKSQSEYRRGHDKYDSKSDRDKRSDRDRGSTNRKYKDHKSNSRHSSSSTSKDKNHTKDHRNGKNRDEERHSDKDRNGKNKDRAERERSNRDKHELSHSRSSSSSKHTKERTYSSSSSKNRDRNDERSSKGESTSHKSNEKSSSKDRSKSISSKDKNRRLNDKERKSSSSSTSNNNRNDKPSSSHESNSKKYKDKKSIDDHYASKEKKNDRRSTDRDSNDGSSNKNGRSGGGGSSGVAALSDLSLSKDSGSTSNSSGGGGSGGSNNSESIETNPPTDEVKQLQVKYIKPKLASNLNEAMKIMKIRKELAKLERQENELALAKIGTVVEQYNTKEETEPSRDQDHQMETLTKGLHLSMEDFAALEARLAEEMGNVKNLYGGDNDDDDDDGVDKKSEKKDVKPQPVTQQQHVTPKKRKSNEYHQIHTPCIKKIVFENINGNGYRTVKCEEIELVVNQSDLTKEKNDLTDEMIKTHEIDAVEILHRSDTTNIRKSNERNENVEEINLKAHKMELENSEIQSGNQTKKNVEVESNKNENFNNKSECESDILHLDRNDNDAEQQQNMTSNEDIVKDKDGKPTDADTTRNDEVDEDKNLKNGFIGWSYDDTQCYYLSNEDYQKQLENLSFYIRKLEREIEIMKKAQKSRKRKIHGTDYPKLSVDEIHSAPKKRVLNDNRIDAHHFYASLTLLVDGTASSQSSFNLPPSPADSDQSGEQKKEELLPVRPKRTPRGSLLANQRYNSEDLYKPRPVFNCSSSRRQRSVKEGNT